MLQHQVRVELEVMTMKWYSLFSKTLALLEAQQQIVSCHIQDTRRGSYATAEVQSVYSTAPDDWV